MPDTLVFHDYYESLEGGGRLCALLARGIGADLGYGFARADHPVVAEVAGQHHDLRAFSRLPLWRQWKLARACQYRAGFVNDYRNVVYSGFYTPLAALSREQGRNLYYCHTPPRFIYDQRQFYREQLSRPLRLLLDQFVHYLQPRYEAAVARMDTVIANSRNIQQRIQHFLGINAPVAYPPCATERYAWLGQQGYYLSTARLDPLKRVDRIIQAFLSMPEHTLVVASGGPETHRLRNLAGDAPNIRFTGWVDEAKLRNLLGHAIATIYLPREEDFGMSPVESMAAGKPVIGVNEGGIPESVIDGETGVLLPSECTPDHIADAVRELSPAQAQPMRTACERRAEDFRTERFLGQMREWL